MESDDDEDNNNNSNIKNKNSSNVQPVHAKKGSGAPNHLNWVYGESEEDGDDQGDEEEPEESDVDNNNDNKAQSVDEEDNAADEEEVNDDNGDEEDDKQGRKRQSAVEEENDEDGGKGGVEGQGTDDQGGDGKIVATIFMSKKGQKLFDKSMVQEGVPCISVKRKVYEWKSWLADASLVIEVARLRNSVDKGQKVPPPVLQQCVTELRLTKSKATTMVDTAVREYICTFKIL